MVFYDGVCKAICLRFARVDKLSLDVFTRFHNTPTPLTRPFAHALGRAWPVKTNQNNKFLTVLCCAVLLWFSPNAPFLSSQNVRFPYKIA